MERIATSSGLTRRSLMTAAASAGLLAAGADLKGVMNASGVTGADTFREVEHIKRSYRTLETLGVPVVTCLNGSALGGGWEDVHR